MAPLPAGTNDNVQAERPQYGAVKVYVGLKDHRLRTPGLDRGRRTGKVGVSPTKPIAHDCVFIPRQGEADEINVPDQQVI